MGKRKIKRPLQYLRTRKSLFERKSNRWFLEKTEKIERR